jgi:hypothetical protein
MKRAIIALLVTILILLSLFVWVRTSQGSLSRFEIPQIGIIIALAGFGLFFAWRRLSTEKRGEPAEDEMSKRVMQKASSLAYFVSLYLWVFVIYINDRIDIDTEVLIGSGVLGMAIVFAICWIVIHIRGVRNE